MKQEVQLMREVCLLNTSDSETKLIKRDYYCRMQHVTHTHTRVSVCVFARAQGIIQQLVGHDAGAPIAIGRVQPRRKYRLQCLYQHLHISIIKLYKLTNEAENNAVLARNFTRITSNMSSLTFIFPKEENGYTTHYFPFYLFIYSIRSEQ